MSSSSSRTMSEKQQATNPLEQFVLLAKTTKGAGAVALIKQALETTGVYVFGELLDMPNIQELASNPEHAAWFNLLNLFAYGTYSDYKANNDNLPQLNPAQMKKLRHLTIVSLATKSKCIPYPVLLQELDLKNLRELEDLIIEVIYADIVHGKLDQKNQQLEVDFALGRDIRPESMKEIVTVLQDWCDSCDSVIHNIEAQIIKANEYRDSQQKIREKIDSEVQNIKKTLKTTQQQDVEEQMVTDSSVSTGDKAVKKTSKTKGLRGSAKFWK
ncbi:COP9 signalosome complex subunit 7b-like isoform X2 [Tubulanus polymorphus]|uniref:COP9 signalosome complex subunit 7b-like isoform X2 n=1 Tax=Tubulanus polymorphus TaxID=672921 RepID=UPI003DA604E2